MKFILQILSIILIFLIITVTISVYLVGEIKPEFKYIHTCFIEYEYVTGEVQTDTLTYEYNQIFVTSEPYLDDGCIQVPSFGNNPNICSVRKITVLEKRIKKVKNE